LFFTYIHRGLLDAPTRFDGGAQILESVRKAGEPWTFGLDPAELPAYLAIRGFTLLEDLSADEYRARYFGDTARAMRGYSFYRAAVARVVTPPALPHAGLDRLQPCGACASLRGTTPDGMTPAYALLPLNSASPSLPCIASYPDKVLALIGQPGKTVARPPLAITCEYGG